MTFEALVLELMVASEELGATSTSEFATIDQIHRAQDKVDTLHQQVLTFHSSQ